MFSRYVFRSGRRQVVCEGVAVGAGLCFDPAASWWSNVPFICVEDEAEDEEVWEEDEGALVGLFALDVAVH